jgi:hypothetical protein
MGKLSPISFNSDMVRVILEGRKTLTRRIVKGTALEWLAPDMFTPEFVGNPENFLCPFGNSGDVLWVRETFNADHELIDNGSKIYYAADYKGSKERKDLTGFWSPSIHMPFKAARIFLRIKSVRVEQLQDITEVDAIAEGIQILEPDEAYFDYKEEAGSYATARGSFTSLWEKINGESSWNANPWVWVIKFERISKEEALK